MSYQLDFQIKHRFKLTEVGITIPVGLAAGDRSLVCDAKVDTGAEFCFFQRELADRLNLDVESGMTVKINTLTGSLTAYGHRLTLHTLGLAFESTLLFNSAYGTTRNLLGRRGWLEHLHLGLTMDQLPRIEIRGLSLPFVSHRSLRCGLQMRKVKLKAG